MSANTDVVTFGIVVVFLFTFIGGKYRIWQLLISESEKKRLFRLSIITTVIYIPTIFVFFYNMWLCFFLIGLEMLLITIFTYKYPRYNGVTFNHTLKPIEKRAKKNSAGFDLVVAIGLIILGIYAFFFLRPTI